MGQDTDGFYPMAGGATTAITDMDSTNFYVGAGGSKFANANATVYFWAAIA
jgi:hypothetical protein